MAVLRVEQVQAELVQGQVELIPVVEENDLERAFAAHGLCQEAFAADGHPSELTPTGTQSEMARMTKRLLGTALLGR